MTIPKQISKTYWSRKNRITMTLGKILQFDVQRYKSETGRNSLRHRAPLIWNSVPDELKKFWNITTFKSNVRKELNYMTKFNFQKEAAVNANKRDNFIYF